MKRLIFVFVPFLVGCSGSDAFDKRFQAERDLWQANREFQRLTIAPQLVSMEQWEQAANQFMEVGDTYAQVPASADSGRAGRSARNARTLAAQAYSRAAEIRMSLRDTSEALEIWDRIETHFTDLSGVQAGAALAKGQVHHRAGNREAALDAYQRVFDAIQAAGPEEAVPGTMIQVPLDMARLESEANRAAAYERAEAYYRRLIENRPGTVEAVAAQSRYVDMASDQGQWSTTVERLRTLESMLLEMEEPPQNPAQVRMAIGQTQMNGLRDSEAAVATWYSLIQDYPESNVAPQAMLSISSHQALAGDPEGALVTLSRVPEEYPNDLQSGPLAVLARARLLEREGRWTEALQVYKRIPIDYPLSEAGLQSYIDIIGHYERSGEESAAQQAIQDADRALAAFIDRDPGRMLSMAARQRLVLVYFKQDRYREGFEELLSLAQATRGTPQGLQFMVLAAQTAEQELGKLEQAAELYDQIAAQFPNSEVGEEARVQAERLRSN